MNKKRVQPIILEFEKKYCWFSREADLMVIAIIILIGSNYFVSTKTNVIEILTFSFTAISSALYLFVQTLKFAEMQKGGNDGTEEV